MWPPDIHGCRPEIRIVTAKKGSSAELVTWKIDAEDNSFLVEPNATVTMRSSHTSPYNFTIGRHDVRIIAEDKAGNTRTCHFTVTIRGTCYYFVLLSVFIFNYFEKMKIPPSSSLLL